MAEVSIALGAVADIATPAEVRTAVHDELTPFRTKDPRPFYSDWVNTTLPAAAGVITTLDGSGPAAGRIWDIRQLLLTGSDDSNVLNALTAVATGAAAAGGAASLPAGAAITGFDLYFATVAAAVTGVVTVTNVAGGTLSYQVSDFTSGGALSIRYPVPIPAAAPNLAITVNVPAIVGGGAWTLDVYGTVQAAWYKAMSNQPGIPTLLVPRGVVPASIVPASSESIFLHYGEHLVANIYGLAANQQVTGIVRYAEWPEGTPESRRIP